MNQAPRLYYINEALEILSQIRKSIHGSQDRTTLSGRTNPSFADWMQIDCINFNNWKIQKHFLVHQVRGLREPQVKCHLFPLIL